VERLDGAPPSRAPRGVALYSAALATAPPLAMSARRRSSSRRAWRSARRRPPSRCETFQHTGSRPRAVTGSEHHERSSPRRRATSAGPRPRLRAARQAGDRRHADDLGEGEDRGGAKCGRRDRIRRPASPWPRPPARRGRGRAPRGLRRQRLRRPAGHRRQLGASWPPCCSRSTRCWCRRAAVGCPRASSPARRGRPSGADRGAPSRNSPTTRRVRAAGHIVANDGGR
jgi:hypothetical protein